MTNQNILNQWINLPDGRRLAARLWLPNDPNPVPAILEYLPYRKRDGTAARDATTHAEFVKHGYACIRVDIAGSGESDGLFDDEYSEQELSDGVAVIAWIADQPWCSGEVGMIGISWGGFNGLQLAFRQPPALKAIVTCCSTVDRYNDDIHYMGGALLTDNFNWGCQMLAYMTRPPDPAIRNDWHENWIERIETLPFMAADWLGHPSRDEFWKHGSVCEDWSAIRAAVLAVGGWSDAYVNAPPALAANLDSPVSALVGPWEHKYPHIARINPADGIGEMLRWFDHYLKGIESAAADLPAYRHFQMEHDNPSRLYRSRKGRWLAEPQMPSSNVSEQALHLSLNGLTEDLGHGELSLVPDLRVGQTAAYFCPGMRVDNELSGDQQADDERSLCFDSAVLSSELELLGRPTARLAISVDKPVGQICLRLCDVAPDGSSQRITYRPFNLNHHRGHDAPEMLEPGRIYQIEVALNECSYLLRPGHRLRLAVSSSYWPIVWPSPETATPTLHFDRCDLILPVRSCDHEIDPQAPDAPRQIVGYQAEQFREPSCSYREEVDADGRYVIETSDDYGMARDPDHGLIWGSEVHQIYAVHPDDPNSALQQARWVFRFERPGWWVEIETESEMTSDTETFYLRRRLKARESDGSEWHRDWSEDLPRGHN
ncbi:MAG: CocE/NonD family hydrolase [Pseudomonadota bacterium]